MFSETLQVYRLSVEQYFCALDCNGADSHIFGIFINDLISVRDTNHDFVKIGVANLPQMRLFYFQYTVFSRCLCGLPAVCIEEADAHGMASCRFYTVGNEGILCFQPVD